jgi:phosphomevalonate kinase
VIQASAPGKLMLAGEYVVATGRSSALSVSVSLRASVRFIAPSALGWRVDAPELGLVGARLDKVPMFAEAVALFPGAAPARVEIRSELGAGPAKPGLGASSAICVAACHALARHTRRAMPSLAQMINAHRRGQGGVGSGYDVATALQGGTIVYRPAQTAAAEPQLESLAWPEGLHAAVFYSGFGSSTRALLERVGAWRLDDVDSFEACIEPLAAETGAFIEAFRGGDVSRILTQAAQLQEELAFFDRVGELGILPGGPCQLAGAIEDAGAIARTSGAGGGDCMWALSDDPECIIRATEAAAELGFSAIELDLSGPGASTEDGEAGAGSSGAMAPGPVGS